MTMTMRRLLVVLALVGLVLVGTALANKKAAAAPAAAAAASEADEDFEGSSSSASSSSTGGSAQFYKIEGRLLPGAGAGAAGSAEANTQLHSSATSARVILYGNGGQQEVIATKDGTFHINDVPPGAYLLEAVSNSWSYPKVRVDVSSRQSGKIKARVSSETQVGQALAYPLQLVPIGPMKFVEDRPGFQIFSLLKNPMVLMIGVTLLMTVLLPRLMTPDTMKELQPNQPQTNQPDPAQLLNKWLDGTKKVVVAPPAGSSASASGGKRKSNN
jgi:hypothetical protein